MPAFEFEALDAQGRTERGVLEGDTARQVRQALRERGLKPIDVEEVRERAKVGLKRDIKLTRSAIGTGELAVLTRQLAALLRASMPLDEVLRTLAEQAEGKVVPSVLLAVRARVSEGASLAQALAEFPDSFPEMYRATVAAGEQAGALDRILDRLAGFWERRDEIGRQLQIALVYPILMLVISTAVVMGLMVYVVPQIADVFQSLGQTLPWLTRALMALAGLAQAYGLWALVALALGGFGFAIALRGAAFRERVHALLLRAPLLGRLLRASQTARFARTLSLLSLSAVPVLEQLNIAGRVVTLLPMRHAVEQARKRVREGMSLNRALAESERFPPIAIKLIASGEKSGELPDMLERIAEHQEREVDTRIKMLMSIIEPALIVLVGGVVLLIVLAILLPIFDLNLKVR
jgi:general secretion pathway protein F